MTSEKRKLPKYWYTEFIEESLTFANKTYGTNWGINDFYAYIGFDGNHNYNGTDVFNNPDSFEGSPEYIPIDEFLSIISGIKPTVLKNIILLKNMPITFVNGKEYSMPKGTVLHNTGKRWVLVKDFKGNDNVIIEQDEFDANKTWYALTTRQATYEVYYIDGKLVEFNSGEITIGCQTISNDIVKKIAKQLLK